MPERIVLDASAAIAVLRAEPEAPAVRRALSHVVGADGDILVPELFWLEVVNVLVRRYGLGADAVVEAIRDLDDAGVRTVTTDRALALLGLDRMLAHGLTAYDAAYLALAEAEEAALLTLDRGLAAAAGDRALRLDGGSADRDARSRYEAGSPRPPRWAAYGRYLAELRRRAEPAG